MPAGVQILLAPGLPLVAALLTWFGGAVRIRMGRVPAAASAWLAAASLVALWAPTRTAVELQGPPLGSGAAFGLRLDAVSFLFGLGVAVPAALLLTFQRRGWRSGGAAALSVAVTLLAILADSIVLKALFVGTVATILLVQLRADHERGTEAYWPAAVAGWLCILWFGATLEVLSQTSVYTAVPVTALGPLPFVLVAAAALLLSGSVPWRPWTAEMWDRPRLASGSLAVALLYPIGPALLVRAYELGGGRWPSLWVNFALAVVGVATAVTAGARAQQAPTRRAYLAETLPGLSGVALTAFALGTPAGVVAGLTAVLAASLVAALLPLLPAEGGLVPAYALALAAGAPPAITFVARLLAIQAAIEAGDAWAFLGVVLALSWVVQAAASARALRLPPLGRGAEAAGSRTGAGVTALSVLAAGVLAGAVVTALCLPATSEVMTFPVGAVAGGRLLVETISGAWPATALGVPAAILLVAVGIAARAGGQTAGEQARVAAGRPFFEVPWAGLREGAVDRLLALRIPEQYRSLADPRAVEAAMARGQPILWVVLILVLAVAVNR